MKKIVPLVVAFVVVAGVAGYGGYAYGKTKASVASGANFAARQGGRAGAGNAFRGTGAGGARGGQFITGEIISKDDTSVTVKLIEGGSKLVFLSASTTIGKTTTGSASDLQSGQFIMVGGTQGSDGTVTAQTIQIRPSMPSSSPR